MFDLGPVALVIFLIFFTFCIFVFFVLADFFLLFYAGQFNGFCGLSGNREIKSSI